MRERIACMWHEKKVRTILFDDNHLGICEEGKRVGAGRARFSESFVVPHLGELVRAPAKRQRLRLREWRTAARI